MIINDSQPNASAWHNQPDIMLRCLLGVSDKKRCTIQRPTTKGGSTCNQKLRLTNRRVARWLIWIIATWFRRYPAGTAIGKREPVVTGLRTGRAKGRVNAMAALMGLRLLTLARFSSRLNWDILMPSWAGIYQVKQQVGGLWWTMPTLTKVMRCWKLSAPISVWLSFFPLEPRP